MSEPVPFCGGSDELKRKKADVQRAVNLMPTPLEAGQNTLYLAPVPGLVEFLRLPGGGGGPGGPGGDPLFDLVFSDPAIDSCFYGFFDLDTGGGVRKVYIFNDWDDAGTSRARLDVVPLLGGANVTTQFTLRTLFSVGGYTILETPTAFWLFGNTSLAMNVGTIARVLKASPYTETTYSPGTPALYSFPDHSGTKMWLRTNLDHNTIVRFELWDTETQTFTGGVLQGDPALVYDDFGFDAYRLAYNHFGVSMPDESAYIMQVGKDGFNGSMGQPESYLSHVNSGGVIATIELPRPDDGPTSIYGAILKVGAFIWALSGNRLVKFDPATDLVVTSYAVDGPILKTGVATERIPRYTFLFYSTSRNALLWLSQFSVVGEPHPRTYVHRFDITSSTYVGKALVTWISGETEQVYFSDGLFALGEDSAGQLWLGGYAPAITPPGWAVIKFNGSI